MPAYAGRSLAALRGRGTVTATPVAVAGPASRLDASVPPDRPHRSLLRLLPSRAIRSVVTAHTGGWRENDLEGEQSPWKDRLACCWKRRCDSTDSSMEKCLEVGGSSGIARRVPATERPAVVAATRRSHRSRAR
jgi:hypothetical protein